MLVVKNIVYVKGVIIFVLYIKLLFMFIIIFLGMISRILFLGNIS